LNEFRNTTATVPEANYKLSHFQQTGGTNERLYKLDEQQQLYSQGSVETSPLLQ